MKKILFILFLGCFSVICSQNIKQHFEEGNFDELVKSQTNVANLKAEELYYVGYAFFRKEDDLKAIEFYDKALEKGFDNPIIYFQKGLSQMYLRKLDEANYNFDIAIAKVPRAEFFIEKGRVYKMQNKHSDEILTYINGLQKAEKSNKYVDLIKVAGNYYYAETKEFDKAVSVYEKGIIDFPTEYSLYEKIIKALNAQDKFEGADRYFEEMIKLYKQKVLPDEMLKYKNLPVDEFAWNGQWVNIFKSFEIPKNTLESLYVIYLLDKSGEKVERKFNLEKTIQLKNSDLEYLICEEVDSGHQSYSVGFKNANLTIQDLRNSIKQILNKAQKPKASIHIKS